jgi:outer membrane lipoprotein-sorting protein
MNKKGLICFVLLLLFVLPNTLFAAPKVNDILKELEFIMELKSEGTAKLVITQQKAKEGTKVYESIYYRRDSDRSFLIVMTAPEVEKGNGYLKQGDNFWMYRRNTRTFQHINRDENIAGSDSKGQDFEYKKLTEMYQPVNDNAGNDKIIETKLGEIPVYQFEVTAKIDDVSYPTQVYWVQKNNLLPLKIQSYSLSGTLMQTAYYLKYTQIEGKYLWIKAMFIDEFEKGHKSLAEVKNISVHKIDNFVFTKAYLESLSK